MVKHLVVRQRQIVWTVRPWNNLGRCNATANIISEQELPYAIFDQSIWLFQNEHRRLWLSNRVYLQRRLDYSCRFRAHLTRPMWLDGQDYFKTCTAAEYVIISPEYVCRVVPITAVGVDAGPALSERPASALRSWQPWLRLLPPSLDICFQHTLRGVVSGGRCRGSDIIIIVNICISLKFYTHDFSSQVV